MNLNLSSLMSLIGCQWSWKCRNNQSHPKKGLYQEMVHDKGFPFVLQPPDLRGPSMKLTNPCCFPFHHSWNPWEVILSHIFTSPSFHLPLWPSLQPILLIPKFGSTQPSLFSLALVYNGKRTHIIVLNYICHELNCVLPKLTVWSSKPQCDCVWNTKWLRLNEVIR